MALTFNSGHALASNVVALVAVESGALVEVKARTLGITPVSGTSFGSGTYGEHFVTAGAGFSAKGADFSPAISTPTSSGAWSLFIVFNNTPSVAAGVGGFNKVTGAAPNISIPTNVTPATDQNTAWGTGTLSLSGAGSVCSTRAAGDIPATVAYVNGSQSVSTTSGFGSGSCTIDGFGGNSSASACDAQLVYWVLFDKVLNSTEVSDLHTSLGASNTFALLGGAAPTPSLHPRRVFPASILNF